MATKRIRFPALRKKSGAYCAIVLSVGVNRIVRFCYSTLGVRRRYRFYDERFDYASDIYEQFIWRCNLYDASDGVLWTVAVEMQLYLIFPLLVWLFRKCPVGTYLGMTAIGVGSAWYFSNRFYSIDQNLVVNQTLTFFSVFANGMMAAWLYMKYTKMRKKQTLAEGLAGIVMAIGAVVFFYQMCMARSTSGRETQWQLDNRFLLSLVFALFVIGMILSHKYFRKILDNRVMKFLAGISFQFYICHQYIAVKLKEFRIPNWSGDELPNMTGDIKWQWQYTILCFVLSLVVAIAMTYLVELPAAKVIKKWYQKKREKKELENEKQ